MKKFFSRLRELRTSTKSGVAGLAALLVMGLPFSDQAESLLQEACKNPEGAFPFLVTGGVTWLVMYVSARVSKTPVNPGKL